MAPRLTLVARQAGMAEVDCWLIHAPVSASKTMEPPPLQKKVNDGDCDGGGDGDEDLGNLKWPCLVFILDLRATNSNLTWSH